MNTTNQEKSVKELLVGKTWGYLNDNFHKFSEANKIKIALALCVKDLPTQLDGEIKHTHFFAEIINKFDNPPSRIAEYVNDNKN